MGWVLSAPEEQHQRRPGPFQLRPSSTKRRLDEILNMRQSTLTPVGPVNLVPLFPGLHRELMTLLRRPPARRLARSPPPVRSGR